MSSMTTWTGRGVGLAVAACLVLAGCGGGSSKTTQSAATTTAAGGAATTTAAGASTGGTTAAPATTAKSGGSSTPTIPGSSASADSVSSAIVAAFKAAASGDCTKATALSDKSFAGASPTGAGTITGVANAMSTLSSSGPSELRSDFATMAKAFTSAASIYKNLGLDDPSKLATIGTDPAKLAELEKVSKLFDDPAFATASDHIETWINGKCPGLSK